MVIISYIYIYIYIRVPTISRRLRMYAPLKSSTSMMYTTRHLTASGIMSPQNKDIQSQKHADLVLNTSAKRVRKSMAKAITLF